MFQLAKWIGMGLIAYFVYEALGALQTGKSASRVASRAAGRVAAALAEPSRQGSVNMTGPGGGRSVNVYEPDGGQHTTRVGRGVIRR